MNPRPLLSSPEQRSHPRGGNLARVTCNALSSQTGHFLFWRVEQPSQLRAQIQSGGQVFVSLRLTSAGAAQTVALPDRSKPLPSPFPKINHVAHVSVSRCEPIITPGGFA